MGCDGTWIHAVGSLAGADGWNITNVAAFPISTQFNTPTYIFSGTRSDRCRLLVLLDLIFNTTCE
jgi:hypothetical protein